MGLIWEELYKFLKPFRLKGETVYSSINFKTKKAFKEAVLTGKKITLFQPNNMFNVPDPQNGEFVVEGPQFPAPHKFYAKCVVKDGYVVSVK